MSGGPGVSHEPRIGNQAMSRPKSWRIISHIELDHDLSDWIGLFSERIWPAVNLVTPRALESAWAIRAPDDDNLELEVNSHYAYVASHPHCFIFACFSHFFRRALELRRSSNHVRETSSLLWVFFFFSRIIEFIVFCVSYVTHFIGMSLRFFRVKIELTVGN